MIKYISNCEQDEYWGNVVTTAGYQVTKPGQAYPPEEHPSQYFFQSDRGRILNEYQLVYIIDGNGYFESLSCKRTKIGPGTMIMLFPGEWHTYGPNPRTGWKEYWIGFKGINMDERVRNGFFSKYSPIKNIGISATLTEQYDKVIEFAQKEKPGFQQVISAQVIYILGLTYFKERNLQMNDSQINDKINRAKIMMREHLEKSPQENFFPESAAKELQLGYTWFRRKFKEYTGVSPIQYYLQIKLAKSKELLASTTMSIEEIGYTLGFTSLSQFSTFFKKYENRSPSKFRAYARASVDLMRGATTAIK